MAFRILSFCMAISILSAMAACGPNKKRDQNLRKAAGANGKATSEEALKQAMAGADLPNLADGKATHKASCATKISVNSTAGEKPITASEKGLLTDGSVFELVSAEIHGVTTRGDQTGYIQGTVTGPITANSDTAARVACHNSAVPAKGQKASSIPSSDIVMDLPAQLTTKEFQMVDVKLQARNGKTAANVTVSGKANLESLLNAKGGEGVQISTVLVSNTDSQLVLRRQFTITSKDAGTSVFTQQAIYKKK